MYDRMLQVNIIPVDDSFVHLSSKLQMLNNVSLQDRILQQLQIVHKNQIFPIWVSKFVHLKICIDDLENGLQVGSLKDSTEIVVKPNLMSSDRNININQNVDDSVETGAINQNYCIPITKYHNRFIYRTVLVEKTLLESDNIYDYCALVSKAHMSIIYKNNDAYSTKNSFVKISLIHEFEYDVLTCMYNVYNIKKLF